MAHNSIFDLLLDSDIPPPLPDPSTIFEEKNEYEDDDDDISMMSVTLIYHNCEFKILSFLALAGGLQASTNITILSTTVRNHQKNNKLHKSKSLFYRVHYAETEIQDEISQHIRTLKRTDDKEIEGDVHM